MLPRCAPWPVQSHSDCADYILYARLTGGATAGETCEVIELLLYMPFCKRLGVYKAEAEVLPSTLHAEVYIPVLLAQLKRQD